jgi:O-antigen ligase
MARALLPKTQTPLVVRRFLSLLRRPETTRSLLKMAVVLACFGLALLGGAAVGLTGRGVFVVAGIIAAGAGFMISLRPEYGVYVLVAFIFSNMSVILEDNFGIPDINKALVALLAVGILVRKVFILREALIFRMTEITMLFVGLAVAISLFTSKQQWDAQYIITNWFKDYIIVLILVQVSIHEHVFKTALWVLVLTAMLIAVPSVYQSVTGDYGDTFYGLAKAPVHEITAGNDSQRISGMVDDPNFYGMIMLSVLPTAAYRMLCEKNGLLKTLGGVATFLILLVVFFTYSRGAFLGLMIVGGLIVYERKFDPIRVTFLALVLFMTLSPILPPQVWDRLETLTQAIPGMGGAKAQSEVSFRGRTSEMLVAVQMFYDHPLFGVGRGNYKENYQTYSGRLGLDNRTEERQAHSLYLEMAAEQGVVGLLAFALMLYFIFYELWRSQRTLKRIGREDLVGWLAGLQIGLVGYLFCSIFLHGDYARYMWLLIAFAAAGSVLAQTELRKYEAQRHLDDAHEASHLKHLPSV